MEISEAARAMKKKKRNLIKRQQLAVASTDSSLQLGFNAIQQNKTRGII